MNAVLPRKKIRTEIHPDHLSAHLERWLKASGLLYPNEKALIRIKGIKAGLIPLEIEVGLDKEPVKQKEVTVKFYGGQKKKELRQGNGVREQAGPSGAESSSE